MAILFEKRSFEERKMIDWLPHDDTIDIRLDFVDVLLPNSRELNDRVVREKGKDQTYRNPCIVISFHTFENTISFDLLIFICSKFDLILFSQMLEFFGNLREMNNRTKEEMKMLLRSFVLLNDCFPKQRVWSFLRRYEIDYLFQCSIFIENSSFTFFSWEMRNIGRHCRRKIGISRWSVEISLNGWITI